MNHHHGIVITQTPFRISFFGGGTDLKDYFNLNGGSVIGAAINNYVYVTVNSLERFFDKKIRLSYSKHECVDAAGDLDHNIVRSVLENHLTRDEEEFVDIHTFADLPSSSGVGSSSSFTVGLLNALYLLKGLYRTPEVIAKEAIHVERERLKEAGGWQDQIFAAYGGFNRIHFINNNFHVEPICLSNEKKRALEESCMMFFTGETRSSASVQQSVIESTSTLDRQYYLKELRKITDEAFLVLHHSNSSDELIHEFGQLLNKAWSVKRSSSSKISNDNIDALYEKGINAGALGGKLCGAGGGGFLLFIVPKSRQQHVMESLKDYKHISIAFEEHGSRVIYSKTCKPKVIAGTNTLSDLLMKKDLALES